MLTYALKDVEVNRPGMKGFKKPTPKKPKEPKKKKGAAEVCS
jgi:hypothetical protein